MSIDTHAPGWHQAHSALPRRLLVVASVVFGSAYLGLQSLPHHLAVSALAAAAFVAFLRCPPLGVTALAIAPLTIPFELGTGTNSRVNVAVLLVVALTGLWVLEMAARHRAELLRSRPVFAVLVFVAVAVLAFFAGLQPWLYYAQTAPLPAQAGGLAIFLLSAGAFLLAAHRLQDLRWLERVTWLFLAIGAFHIAGRFSPAVGALSRALSGPVGPGSVFWTWLSVLAFSQAVFNRHLRTWWRVALGLLLLATLYAALYQSRGWASGWLPAAVAIGVALLAGVPRLIPLALLGGSMVATIGAPLLHDAIFVGDNDYSLLTRVEALRILAQIIRINPVLGLGFANYYWYTPLFPIVGLDGVAYAVRFNSHNNYIDIVAQTGLVGLAGFLWFAWTVGWLGWQLRRRVPEGFARAYVYGAIGGLAGMLVAALLGDWILPFTYNIGLAGFRYSVLGWLFLGGLVALEQTIRHRSPAEREAGAGGR